MGDYMKELAIGIDIGGTNTKFGLVDKDGNCISEGSIKTPQYEKAEDFVKDLSGEIKKIISIQKEECTIKGIGIGAPNGNYFRGTIEFAPNLRWKGIVKLADLFKNYFDYPVILTNDADAAAIGEMIYGAAKNMKDFILVTLGTGLGSGFVANGEMIYGHDGFAGELGHTIVIPDGRQCGCGRKGCLEQYASATGIVKTVIEMLDYSYSDSLLKKYKKEKITSEEIFEAAKAGDKIAIEAFDYTGKVLGMGLANAVAITSPEAIILFGGLSLAGDYIFKPTKKYMEENLLNIYKNKVKIIPSALNDKNAAILGASALVWKEAG
jgi:glucokinase